MMKTSLIAAGLLALSGTVAFAQPSWMPGGPGTAPGGADGATRTRDVGTSPTANAVGTGQTQSSTMLEQQIKQQSQAGATQAPVGGYNGSVGLGGPDRYQAQAMDEPMRGPHRVAMTDEYGFKYDARGDRLNARGYVISPHTP